MKKVFFFLPLLTSFFLFGEAPSEPISKIQIVYLMQAEEFDKALTLYTQYKKEIGHHDFEVLSQLAQIILDQDAKSTDPERQLLSIFGAGIGGITSSFDLLTNTIVSRNPQVQMASIQILSEMQDDRADEILTKAMASDFFPIRMEAAFQLSSRKHRKACGYIESLMYKLPPQMRFLFPQFFALIGTKEAISLLKHMMGDKEMSTRIEATLNAAKFGRDDLLPIIRAKATHLNIPEQEASASALGFLKDSKSIPKLKMLAKSPASNVKLAALRSLHLLGDTSFDQEIIEMAKTNDIFAIASLGSINDSEEVLLELLRSKDLQVKFNAAIALLEKKDRRCLSALLEILVRDMSDIAFFPTQSIGRSLSAWKVIPSAKHHLKEYPYDIYSVSLSFREHVLKSSMQLNENDFLILAEHIFESKQTELVPLLVRLLENLQTPKAIKLLQNKAQKAGAPLIRTYCTLGCFRLKQEGGYENALKEWITQQKNNEMIRFKEALPFDIRLKDTSFELTPDDSARLLIESYQALSDRHEEECIDILIKALQGGNPKNRCVIAGLILKSTT